MMIVRMCGSREVRRSGKSETSARPHIRTASPDIGTSARPHIRTILCLLLLLLPLPLLCPSPAFSAPKYARDVTPLSRDSAYFRRAPAPDFWTLAPYYAAQRNGSSCALATAAMVLNAARADIALKASDRLVTQESLIEGDGGMWRDRTVEGGAGVSLTQFAALLEEAFKRRGVRRARVTAVEVAGRSPAVVEGVRRALVTSEASAGDFVILNFLQGVYTGDPEGMVGHFAPVGAYDAERERALVMDPDREWYEPYWVPLEKLVRGMATRDDDSGGFRGYIEVRVR